jgi:hypothetical protein
MSFRIVLINLALFFVPRGFVRSVAERLVFGKAAHANPDRFALRFDLEGSLVRFYHFAHQCEITRRLGHGKVGRNRRCRADELAGGTKQRTPDRLGLENYGLQTAERITNLFRSVIWPDREKQPDSRHR